MTDLPTRSRDKVTPNWATDTPTAVEDIRTAFLVQKYPFSLMTAHGVIRLLLQALENEPKRIGARVRETKILRLEADVPALEQVNDVLSLLADDIEDNWRTYDEE